MLNFLKQPAFGCWRLDFADEHDEEDQLSALLLSTLIFDLSHDFSPLDVLDLRLGFMDYIERCSEDAQQEWLLMQKVVEKKQVELNPLGVIFPPALELVPLIQKDLDERGLERLLDGCVTVDEDKWTDEDEMVDEEPW